MRKIPNRHVAAMIALFHLWALSAAALTAVALHRLPGAGLVEYAAAFLFAWIALGTALYRALLRWVPLHAGPVPPGSIQEFRFNVLHLPIYFFLIAPLTDCGLVPTPLTRRLYRLFGARIGDNTYPGLCKIFDPAFVTIGRNVVLGHRASLIPHVLEGDRTELHPIRIGDDATIGVNAVLLAGVSVGTGAVVAAGAVVPKFTRIGPREIWGGLPARRIGFVADDRSSESAFPKETAHV